jgi:hypothetical protein
MAGAEIGSSICGFFIVSIRAISGGVVRVEVG